MANTAAECRGHIAQIEDAAADIRPPCLLLTGTASNRMRDPMKSSAATVSFPRGLTFPAAMWLLGAFAAVQVVAALWKVLPPSADAEDRVATITTAPVAPAPFRPDAGEAVDRPARPAQDPVRVQEAMALISQSDGFQRIGEWDDALASLEQAMTILHDNPQLMMQRAFVLGRMGREAEAIDQLDELLETPDLDEDLRFDALRLTDLLVQTQENIAAVNPGARAAPARPAPESAAGEVVGPAAPLLEDVGLQPGATLGIVDIREITDEPGYKNLRIAIKSRPTESVDPSEVKVHVQFFEETELGDVTLTESLVRSEWFTPPVNWADNEPELLDVIYPLPGLAPDAGEGEVANSYHGYLIGLYYRDELQDSRSVPGNLERRFPLKLFLDPQSQ